MVSVDVFVLHIWSDGPSSQFKNKYIAASLLKLEEKHSLQIQWHYFATSHGKGCVDGIGGLVKRKVTERVIQRRAIVKDMKSFYECCLTLEVSVKFFLISTDTINEFNATDMGSTFDDAPEMKGIKAAHHYLLILIRK